MFYRVLKQPLWKYDYSNNKKLFSLKFKLNPWKIGEMMQLVSEKVSGLEPGTFCYNSTAFMENLFLRMA